MATIVDLPAGIAFVVTDLHGDWQAYTRYRDQFLSLYDQQQADYFILLGDLIHSYGPQEEDASLPMVQDVIRLQGELGADRVIMLLGNHELPHIYGITLSKGDLMFTPRFEWAMGEERADILAFFKSLPFVIRTSGGVMLTHAGATASHATPKSAEFIAGFDHQTLLDETDVLLNREDVQDLIVRNLGPGDDRYLELLRGFIVGNLQEWQLLWDFFFNQCEVGMSPAFYRQVLKKYLEVYSTPDMTMRTVVTGHITTRGGHKLVTEHHLRLSSWAHATPKNQGSYLLFDVAAPVKRADELEPFLHPLP
jgi:hypothetical protein